MVKLLTYHQSLGDIEALLVVSLCCQSRLIGLTKQLAYEAARYNINVNAVCPSQTLTEMLSNSMNSKELKELSRNIPIKGVAQIGDQVGPILFLCSKASYMGTFIDVNEANISQSNFNNSWEKRFEVFGKNTML